MGKLVVLLAVVVMVVLLAGSRLLSMRTPVPFQEVIALDRGIAVVNAQKWFMKDLRISCSKDGGGSHKAVFERNGACVFTNLRNGQEYSIEIGRTDLKGMLLYKRMKRKVIPLEGGVEYYVLVGASIGKSWNVSQLPERLNMEGAVVFGNRTVYQFDKSDVVDDLVKLPFPVSGVILKECSAYFPRDLAAGKEQLISWIDKLRQKGIRPILATTVPLTAKRAGREPEKQNSLLLFNDFIRKYVTQNNVGLLDLEQALRVSDSDRHLRDDYAQEDGSHLVEKAYSEALDRIIAGWFWICKKDITGRHTKEGTQPVL